MNYLRKLKLADPVQQILLEEYVMRIELGSQCVQRLEEHMEKRLKTWDRKPYVQALMAFRGFQIVAAMTQVSELGDLLFYLSMNIKKVCFFVSQPLC